MTEPVAPYVPCKHYLPWTEAPGHKLNWAGCYYLSIEPDPKIAFCELRREDNEYGGKKCPWGGQWA
jgi:hypothetical protein